MNYIFDDKLREEILLYLRENLKESRYGHTLRVAETARKMAHIFGEGMERAEIASLLHDVARNISEEKLQEYIAIMDLDRRYEGDINLAHSKIGAYIAERDFGIEDEDILNAISFHTTGRAGMSLLEKIVFLADAVEPARNYPGVDEIRRLAYENIDLGCLKSLEGTLSFLRKRQKYIDSDTVEAFYDIRRNYDE